MQLLLESKEFSVFIVIVLRVPVCLPLSQVQRINHRPVRM